MKTTLLVIALAFTLGACKPEENIIKPDPCAGAKEVKARFSVIQAVYDTLVVSDTILTGGVQFRADDIYDSYEWKIGGDPRTFTTPDVTLFFEYPDPKMPIRLIAKRKPSTACFPNDDGIDTLERMISIRDYRYPDILGSYSGYHTENPTDTFTVDILQKLGDKLFVMYNINRGFLDTTQKHISFFKFFEVGNSLIRFRSDVGFFQGCKGPTGTAYLENGGKNLKVEYSIISDTISPIKRKNLVFLGRRIK